ncbi:hypothetical protein CEY16_04250 [Halalkalibacillus sediminis]|uniref:PNPLA domain-containing protein n=1 Tax=Halalkalibacillus sediminis TaxID=2018042 RepID=A0A2I0QXB0_9BACI|nr:patatin-like phospholipase family protein [Halalkalibacillus sediminis]PKR78973.1 hypothetical protein CEY16_04250 [Halalkalibacillus sediminis]
MEVDGVFSGGGVKAFAFLGAIDVCEKKNIEFTRVAGSSAGALIASLVKAGYKYEELYHMLDDVDLKEFLDQPFWMKNVPLLKWLLLYYRMGLYKGDALENWIDEKLQKKGLRTFGDLPDKALTIIGTDLTNGRMAVFPNDLSKVYGINPKDFSIAKAVRMSASIPYFFQPVTIQKSKHQKSLIVDGGVLSNFPYWVFNQKSELKARPSIGIKLNANYSSIPKQKVNNSVDLLHALFLTMLQAHDARHISKDNAKDIIFIPIKDIHATNFELSKEEKSYLIEVGRLKANAFFKKWSG